MRDAILTIVMMFLVALMMLYVGGVWQRDVCQQAAIHDGLLVHLGIIDEVQMTREAYLVCSGEVEP